jgi:hypothetical protein
MTDPNPNKRKGGGGLCLTSRDAADSISVHVGQSAVEDQLHAAWGGQLDLLTVHTATDADGNVIEYLLKAEVELAAGNSIEAAAAAIAAAALRIINHSNRGAGNNRQEMQFRGSHLFQITRDLAKVKTPK